MEYKPLYTYSEDVAIFAPYPDVVILELHLPISNNTSGRLQTSPTASLDLPSFEDINQPVVSGLERHWSFEESSSNPYDNIFQSSELEICSHLTTYQKMQSTFAKPMAYPHRGEAQSLSPDHSDTDPVAKQRLEKRKMQNRKAQQAFRERKDRRVQELEKKVAIATTKYQELLEQHRSLKDQCAAMKAGRLGYLAQEIFG